jgi:adenylate cyclase
MQTSGRRRLRATFFFAVSIGMTGLALLAHGLGLLDGFERQTIDTRFSIRGEKRPPNLVIVAIDEASIKRLGQWPFRRSLHAAVIDNLRESGAKVIAFDVQFTEPTVETEDNALIDAVERARGKVVLATTEVGPNGSTNVFGGDDVVRSVGARVGDSQLPNDRYAVLRRMPYSVLGLKNFAIVTAEVARGRRVDHSQLGGSTAWIDYAGPPGTIPAVSYWRVAKGKFPRNRFRHKVVVVGATAITLQDVHATSTSGSDLMAGLEVQANEVSTALRGFPLKGAPGYVDVLLIVLLGLIAPAVSMRRPPVVALTASVVAGGLFAVATQLAFNRGLILAFVAPLTSLVLSSVGALAMHYVLATFERQRVRDVFSRFVPEQVVDQVLARTDADLRLGGREVVATVMFTDIRGFTTTAETMPADKVIEMLNQYLGEMSEAILAHGGTLLSYLGDGILAVFGAPIDQEDHADRAFATSCEMLDERLPRFNAWLRDQGLGEGYKIGIGLNTGPIMSGNVGHTRRLEYTAIGDTVNTASRIEGMTKGTPYSLFLAESTHARLTTANGLVYVDELEVRGRTQKLKVWGMVASAAASAERQPAK